MNTTTKHVKFKRTYVFWCYFTLVNRKVRPASTHGNATMSVIRWPHCHNTCAVQIVVQPNIKDVLYSCGMLLQIDFAILKHRSLDLLTEISIASILYNGSLCCLLSQRYPSSLIMIIAFYFGHIWQTQFFTCSFALKTELFTCSFAFKQCMCATCNLGVYVLNLVKSPTISCFHVRSCSETSPFSHSCELPTRIFGSHFAGFWKGLWLLYVSLPFVLFRTRVLSLSFAKRDYIWCAIFPLKVWPYKMLNKLWKTRDILKYA